LFVYGLADATATSKPLYLCFINVPNGFTFLVSTYPVFSWKGAIKRVFVYWCWKAGMNGLTLKSLLLGEAGMLVS